MSNIRKSRTRTRSSPAHKSGTIDLGRFETKDRYTNKWNLERYERTQVRHNFQSWEMTSDESHGRPPYDIGGPFQKISVSISPIPGSGPFGPTILYNRAGNRRYIGGFGVGEMGGFYDPPWFQNPDAPMSAKQALVPNMGGLVTKAWNGARPKIQQVDGLVAIAEIGEIPSMLRTSAQGFHQAWQAAGGNVRGASQAPRRASEHFLNHHFGWVPFVATVRDSMNTYRNSTDIISRLTRNNGRTIRRKVTVEETVSEEVVLTGYNQPGFSPHIPDEFLAGPGMAARWEIVDRVRARTVGSGAFSYYLPEFDMGRPDYHSRMNNVRRHLDIYGIRINPSNIYQAVPWSWAVDWVSNVGHYVKAFSDTFYDNIAAKYFYVTRHYHLERVYKCTIPTHTMGPIVLEQVKTLSIKKRIEASSPFGIDLAWNGLNSRQLAIAGALGITRSR